MRIGSSAADGTNISQWRKAGYQMIFFPLVFCWAYGWCMSYLGILQNNEVELGDFPQTSNSLFLCVGSLGSTVMVRRRILCLATP